MELVMFIENHFKITVENEDLEFVNFSTIDNMARFIESKTAASQS
jgi:acyl carrier protein